MLILATFIQHSIRNLSHNNQEIKITQIRKAEVKLSLSADNMIVYSTSKILKTPLDNN